MSRIDIGRTRLPTWVTRVRSVLRSMLSSQNPPGGVSQRLDRCIAGVEERDDAARAGLEPLVAPREGADQAALSEHQLDVAPEVLGMQQAFLEGPVVEREHVGDDLSAREPVDVLERAEKFLRALAVLPGELRGDVRPHAPD